jgi:signal transduction histidine kinase
MATSVFTILGWIRLFRIGHRNLDPEIAWTLNALEKTAQTQNALISEVRELQALLQKKRELPRHWENVVGAILALLDDLQADAKAAGVTLSFQTELKSLEALVNAGKLRLSLEQLIRSAVRHTNRGGSICVKLEQRDEGIAVDVCDTGVGLSKEKLRLLYGSTPKGTRASSEAAGLRLSLAIGFIELHGGHIEVCSEGEDKGATFSIWLPITS